MNSVFVGSYTLGVLDSPGRYVPISNFDTQEQAIAAARHKIDVDGDTRPLAVLGNDGSSVKFHE